MVDINPAISIITLNVSSVNKAIQMQKLWETQGQLSTVYKKFTLNINRLKVKGQTKVKGCHVNTNQKKAGVAILISDKIDFRARKIIRAKEGHYTMREESILQEDIKILNMYTSKNKALKHMRQKLTALKGEIDKATVRAGDFNMILSM